MKIYSKKPYLDDFEFGDELWVPEYEQQSYEHPMHFRTDAHIIKSDKKFNNAKKEKKQ